MRTLIIAGQGLRGAPVRSLLVIVALTLGMLGFVAVLSANEVMKETVTQRALLAGGAQTSLAVSVTGPTDAGSVREASEQLRLRSGAAAASVTMENADLAAWADSERLDQVKVTFAEPSLLTVRPFPVLRGTWLTEEDSLAPRVAVNEAAVDYLAGHNRLELGDQDVRETFVVTGVVRDGASDPHLYANLSAYRQLTASAPTVEVLLHDTALNADDARVAAKQLVDLGAPYEVSSVRRTDTLAALQNEISTTSQVLLVLAGLSLLSTIVGIMNVGLATARTRAKEFTLRRTMGASRGHVALIVMTESQILALGAAVVAFAGSYLLFPVVVGAFGSQLGISPPPYDPSYGVICLVVASATAALSSIVPALLSYRRDLSGAMRE